PELGTRLVRSTLNSAKPKNFSDLLQIEGLTHGTGVWKGNADELISSGQCTISDVIGCRDDIMMTLIHRYGMDTSLSFKITEFTRKNKTGLPTPTAMVDAMRESGVPEWYITSLQKIRYMFPKAHAAAYATDAIRLGWYKIYYPVEFYAAYFSAAPEGFDAEIVLKGPEHCRDVMREITNKGRDASEKEKDVADALLLVNEYYSRGFSFLPLDLKKSHATKFLPEDGKIRVPLSSLPDIGVNAALSLMNACEENDITSVEQLKSVSKVTKSVIQTLEKNGLLDNLLESDQMTLSMGMDDGFTTRSATRKETAEKESPAKTKSVPEEEAEDSSEQIQLF
ncbi:MAG: hypothetical protein II797_00225, partial [Clostridia bacterium]|nr:hypothetical protein [Clostridia bacterium]